MSFTLLLWIFMFLVYISAKKNKINQWCAIAIFIFSFGTFKEFFYFKLAPVLVEKFGYLFTYTNVEVIYSIMTAILYNFVMPCCVIFALYFSSFQYNKPKLMGYLKCFIFFPAFIILIIFTPGKTSYYQQHSDIFWHVATIYNIFWGTIMSVLMIKSVMDTKMPVQKRQKKLLSVIILPPIWYWLITIFVIHSLKITSLYKIWQQNAFLLAFSLNIYIVTAFTEGIMGLRLQKQNFLWDSDMRIASKGTEYTSHILKNEIIKMEWCIDNLSHHFKDGKPEELEIMERSATHLKQFVDKTQLYSNDVELKKETVNVLELINSAIFSTSSQIGEGVKLHVDCLPEDYISCDLHHMTEVLNNLILNGADAMNKKGCITVKSRRNKNMQVIEVKDEGVGIPRKYLRQIYTPYFTTKKTSSHFGLGLSYCYNVLKKHKGYINIKSEEGKGSTFSVFLPVN